MSRHSDSIYWIASVTEQARSLDGPSDCPQQLLALVLPSCDGFSKRIYQFGIDTEML